MRIRFVRWLPALLGVVLDGGALASPVGMNLGFESGLSGWTSSNVAIRSPLAYEGVNSLDLKNGWVEQTFTGLTPGEVHTVFLAYHSLAPSGQLHHAEIRVDGAVIGALHLGPTEDGDVDEFLRSAGFEFVATSTTATLRFQSLQAGSTGLLIDGVRIENGPVPAPPAEDWANLTVKGDAWGGRGFVNGGFESALGNPATDPDNSGPIWNEHLAGYSLPGWRVTRTNVDVIRGSGASPPEGANALDTSGHGPGAIAQTITGLTPGATYTVSFQHARHIYWGTGDMTGEVRVNGLLVKSLVRTYAQRWAIGYERVEIPLIAPDDGAITVEVRSTVTDKGGCIIYDDFRIREGGDTFTAWAVQHGIAAVAGANSDGDSMPDGLEFLFGTDPLVTSAPPLMEGQTLAVPLNGGALAQGFEVAIETTRDLTGWTPVGDPASGLTLQSDTSGPGIDGVRTFAADPGEGHLFWRYELVEP